MFAALSISRPLVYWGQYICNSQEVKRYCVPCSVIDPKGKKANEVTARAQGVMRKRVESDGGDALSSEGMA